ncbi:sulfonate transport system permease protein [Methylobacterium sp. 174MFSha1.1]|uniref:ABC transporter permease n=1 Tax=Methylobacterium sp. 174MFSha1.1 TaxID=1502749 RepID=UPI0008EDE3FB|nr:ABC transporter permease [Methylobacterium sp. 174MFSha1.1]SFV08966.1 sulfonate transport system permease protein [Methylobacterium sp. 174MFSha1.1]
MTALAWPGRGIAASLHRRVHRHLAPIALGLLVPLGLLVAWAAAAASGGLPQQILPAPRIVAETLVEMVRSGELARHAGISGLRVLAGFSLGGGLGLMLGAAMGLSRRVEDTVSPLFTALAQVPTLGWIPLLMLFLGIGETLKVVVIAKAALVPVTLNTASGIRAIPEGYREVARAYRFTRVQTVRRLILPASVPPVFTGIRYGLTKAWTALVAVELLASAEGLGYLLVWGRQMFWLDTMIVAMALIGFVGVAMDAVLARIEARLQHWRIDAP